MGEGDKEKREIKYAMSTNKENYEGA